MARTDGRSPASAPSDLRTPRRHWHRPFQIGSGPSNKGNWDGRDSFGILASGHFPPGGNKSGCVGRGGEGGRRINCLEIMADPLEIRGHSWQEGEENCAHYPFEWKYIEDDSDAVWLDWNLFSFFYFERQNETEKKNKNAFPSAPLFINFFLPTPPPKAPSSHPNSHLQFDLWEMKKLAWRWKLPGNRFCRLIPETLDFPRKRHTQQSSRWRNREESGSSRWKRKGSCRSKRGYRKS